MKKRSISILFALLFAVTACGCAQTDVTVALDEVKPWQNIGYEKCNYKIERTYVPTGEVVAQGTYSTELAPSEEYDINEITNTFSLTYADTPHANNVDTSLKTVYNAGCTDTYVGHARFRRDTLIPLSADKKYNIAQRPLCFSGGSVSAMPAPQTTDLPERVVARYMLDGNISCADPRGYGYTVNYDENKATFTTTEASSSKVGNQTQLDYKQIDKTITLAQNTCYDNEQLTYVVRAMSATKKNSSATFYLSNIFDSYCRGEYVRYTMSLSTEKNTSNESILLDADKYFVYETEGELTKDEFNHYVVPCVVVSVSLSSSQPGPAIEMLITDPSVKIIEKSRRGNGDDVYYTSKLLVQMKLSEFSVTSVTLEYETVYTLTDYTSTRQQ